VPLGATGFMNPRTAGTITADLDAGDGREKREMTTDLVPIEAAVIPWLDPEAAVMEAERAATVFKDVIERRRAQLITKIAGRDHVRIEGWLTLGTLAAVLFRGPVTPYVVWVRPVGNADGEPIGYEARAEARCGDRVMTAAEAECLFNESNWKGKDDFAVRSMAQTRACSKALAFALRWVMVLAGYEGTPAEEMIGDVHKAPKARTAAPTPTTPARGKADADALMGRISTMLTEHGLSLFELCDRLACQPTQVVAKVTEWVKAEEGRTVKVLLDEISAEKDGQRHEGQAVSAEQATLAGEDDD